MADSPGIGSVPQVTVEEIQEWENKFKQTVTPQVEFVMNKEGGHSFRLYNGPNGIDAEWSGVIKLAGEDYIKWTFSIQNDPSVQTSMKLVEDNYKIFSNLYNFYDNWKDEWGKVLTIPKDDQAQNTQDTIDQTANAAQNINVGAPNSPQPPGPGPGSPMTENKRTKNNIIKTSSDRMRLLAGL